jgi:cytoskeletal protein CcmA (bactofilin family)
MQANGLATSQGAPSKMATGALNTSFSVLGSDVVISGDISASVDLHIDGKIEGDLRCAHLVQGETSEIRGAIVADSAKIAGLVHGSIEAQTLVIHASARVIGDVHYANITIETGGTVEGKLHHKGNQSAVIPALEIVTIGE